MMQRCERTERQRAAMSAPLPGRAGHRGLTAAENRACVDGLARVLRSGGRWSDRPARDGETWKPVRERSPRGGHGGVRERLSFHLAHAPDNAYRMIESTIVRAHQGAASGKGGGRGA